MQRTVLILLTQEDEGLVKEQFSVDPGIPFEERGNHEIDRVARRMLDASGVVAERVSCPFHLGYANRQAFLEEIQAFCRESDKCSELLSERRMLRSVLGMLIDQIQHLGIQEECRQKLVAVIATALCPTAEQNTIEIPLAQKRWMFRDGQWTEEPLVP